MLIVGITLVPVGGDGAPNVGFAAIFDEQSQRTYSIVWPCADVSEGEALQRLATPSLELIAEGGQDYWERRFDAEEKFDWYCGWDTIEGTVLDTLAGVESDGKPTVLITGNGNSPLPVELEAAVKTQAAKGSRLGKECHIVAVDYVESVVDRMRKRYPPDLTIVQWLVGDLTDWSSFDGADMGVNVIVDKGCLDAFLVKRAVGCSLHLLAVLGRLAESLSEVVCVAVYSGRRARASRGYMDHRCRQPTCSGSSSIPDWLRHCPAASRTRRHGAGYIRETRIPRASAYEGGTVGPVIRAA
eukprot:COSAG02_NODE_346_length_24113_cov_13.213001_23_plen_299_part_00